MKKTPKAPAKQSTDVAEHMTPPIPGLVLQVCPKCDAKYNRNTLDKCPACGEPRPDAATTSQEQTAGEVQTPAAAPDPWPFLKIPAEQGGVIVGTDERDGVRDLTKEDIGAAHEVQVPNPTDDDDVYPISWQTKDGHNLAIVPRWVASRLHLLCEQDTALDFRIEKPEAGGVQVEVTE